MWVWNLVFSTLLASTSPKICLLLDKGGKDDKSFNAAAFRGAEEAKKKQPFDLVVKEAADDASIEKMMRSLARQCTMINAIGFVMAEPIQKVASDFPQVSFVVIDGKATGNNIRSVLFRDEEGAFLVGYLAGLATKTGKIGFVGGMDVELIQRFQKAYEKGAKAANPKIKILTQFVGADSSAWRNPSKCKLIANSQYKEGADILFVAAGASGMGAFDAAEEAQKFIIGVDSNQNWIKPGRVLTSMLKRVDLAVEDAILSKLKNKFSPGIFEWGIKETGIDYAIDSHNEKLIAPYRGKIEQVKKEILQGKLVVK